MKYLSIALILPLALLAQTDDTQKLRDQIAAQQKQLNTLRQALDIAQKTLDSQQLQLDHLVASRTPTATASAVTPFKPLSNPEPAASPVVVAEKEQISSPLAFHIGGADFAPRRLHGFLHGLAIHRYRERRRHFLRRGSL